MLNLPHYTFERKEISLYNNKKIATQLKPLSMSSLREVFMRRSNLLE